MMERAEATIFLHECLIIVGNLSKVNIGFLPYYSPLSSSPTVRKCRGVEEEEEEEGRRKRRRRGLLSRLILPPFHGTLHRSSADERALIQGPVSDVGGVGRNQVVFLEVVTICS